MLPINYFYFQSYDAQEHAVESYMNTETALIQDKNTDVSIYNSNQWFWSVVSGIPV